MNARVLVYSNPLVVDKIGKTFKFWKDSGFLYTRHLISKMPSSWRYTWVIPDKIPAEEREWFTSSNTNVELLLYPYSTSIHQNRYNFSVASLNSFYTYKKDIDLILNNQPEVSANFRVWATNQRRDEPAIFSFYHWIDCEESRKFADELGGYSSRQHDGSMASDLNLFHNNYARGMFLNQMKKEFINIPADSSYTNFTPPAISWGDAPMDTGLDSNIKIILFNHRLNNTTNWKEVVETCEEIYKGRQDFVLWLTDDSKIKELEYLKSKPFVRVMKIPPESYGYMFSKLAHFSICNHKGYSTWNMALVDSFWNGCLGLVPNREVYKDMFKNSIREFGEDFSHNGNLKEMIVRLLNNSVNYNRLIAKNVVHLDANTFDFKDGSLVTNTFRDMMCKKASAEPKKYNDVLNYILKNNGASKRDWVNEFWSFHANSNFQKIRAKLLLSGQVDDDTTKPETFYTPSFPSPC